MQADLSDINLTPREVVERLDKYIVGQVSLQRQCYFCVLFLQVCYHVGFLCCGCTSLLHPFKQQSVHETLLTPTAALMTEVTG